LRRAGEQPRPKAISTAVDNPARTAAYRAEMIRRRADLAVTLEGILPNALPFVWELGCGHGHMLTAYAHAHPERVCIGVDIASDRIARAVRKRDRAQLSNLFFLHAEARLFLEAMPSHAKLGAVFILFPDPWPKSRHHKHRILQPSFLSAAAERAAPACRLYFRTDHRPYFDDAEAAVRGHDAWRIVDEKWPFEFETVFQSRAPNFHSLIARCASAPMQSATSVIS
jgi:tRNA (guanine-N7-)-methyltransferase